MNNYNNLRWKKKSKFLSNVRGEEVIEEQKKINADKDSYTVSSQIFRRENGLYDAFIYYEENPQKVIIPQQVLNQNE